VPHEKSIAEVVPGGSPVAGLTTAPGGSPGAGHFLLSGQKKVTKEKAAPVSRACRRVPVLLDEPGGCGTRSRYEKTHMNVRELRQSSPNSLVRLCYSAAHRGPWKEAASRCEQWC